MGYNHARSFFILLSTNVITKICWALTLLLLLRGLGVESFGVLATLWSAASIAAGLTDLGSGQVLLREGSRNHSLAQPLAIQAMIIQSALTCLIALILSIGAWWLVPMANLSPAQRACVIVLGILTPLVDWFQSLFTVYSQIGGRYGVYSRIRSIRFIAVLACLALAVAAGGKIVAVSVTYFLLTTAFALWMAKETWPLLPRPSNGSEPLPYKQLIKQGIPFLVVMTLTLAYGRIEVSTLGSFGYISIAGAYHIIYQLVLLMYSVSGMFFTVLNPRLYSHRGDRAALVSDFRETARWLSLLTWLTTPSLFIFAHPILVLIGGSGFDIYANMFRVLLLLIILIAPASTSLNFLLPLDRLHARVICDVVGIAMTTAGVILCCLQSHPEYTAYAAVVGYTLAATAAHSIIHGMLPGSTFALFSEYLSAASRALPSTLITWFAPGPWWFRASIGALSFCCLLLVTRHPISQHLRLRRLST
ncbi:lipopolysaccharide biosynthesis protein [Dyella humi]|uniref:Lipopolysaccharide biosynthesis protein n=1 Tax=Dyella humi TaxID=1770547 RepID=A0ABW8IFA8_9GAMM